MVLGEKLAFGLIKRQNRQAYCSSTHMINRMKHCLEGKTKRASRYRALQGLFNDLYSGRTLEVKRLYREGRAKDEAMLWTAADHGKDPRTGENVVAIILTLVPYRDPTNIWMHEAIVLTHHAAQRLLQSVHTDNLYVATLKTGSFAIVAFEIFKRIAWNEHGIEHCEENHELTILDANTGWMPADFHEDHITIRTVIAPESLNPRKRRVFDDAIACGKHWVCFAHPSF